MASTSALTKHPKMADAQKVPDRQWLIAAMLSPQGVHQKGFPEVEHELGHRVRFIFRLSLLEKLGTF
jgi:hypothetical protein